MWPFDGLRQYLRKPDAQPKPMTGEIALANTRARMFGGGEKAFEQYNPSQLVTQKGLTIFDRMSKDDQCKSALSLKKLCVLGQGWEVDAPEGEDPEWEPAEFIRRTFTDLEDSFEQSVENMLTALDYGFSITEMVYKEEDSRIKLSALKTRAPYDFTFGMDGFGNTQFLKQNDKTLPIEKFIVYSYDARFNNPYGRSDLEAAYRHWWLKDSAHKWLAMLLERMGIPPIFVLYDQNSFSRQEQLDQLIKAVKNMQAATVGAIPRGNSKDNMEMWTPELAGNVSSVFIPSLQYLDQSIAKALLMPGLLGMTNDNKEGSYARSQTHFDVFMLVVKRIRGYIQNSIIQKQIVVPLVDLNFGVQKKYPEWKWLPIEDDFRLDILARWQSLVTGGIATKQEGDESYVREVLKMPEFDETKQIIEEPEEPMAFGKPRPTQKFSVDDQQFEQLMERMFG